MAGKKYGKKQDKKANKGKNITETSSLIYKKDDLIELRIEDLTEEGNGVGKIDGYTVFVHNALPGDHVESKLIKVKRGYAIGIVHQMHEKSSERIEAPCPYASKCGGCQLQDLSYGGQTNYKEGHIKASLSRIGQVSEVEMHWDGFRGMENPFHYRNKGIYQLSPKRDLAGFDMGFYRTRSHDLVDVKKCMLQSETANEIMEKFRVALEGSGLSIYDENTGKGAMRRVMIRTTNALNDIDEEAMLVLVTAEVSAEIMRFAKSLAALDGRIKSIYLNINSDPGNTALSQNYDHVYGKVHLIDYIGNTAFKISPQSFFQVNSRQTQVLYDEVVSCIRELENSHSVLDLYCGIGSIGAYVSKHIPEIDKIVGVEVVESAVEDARENALLNGLTNTEYHTGAAEDVITALKEQGEMPDVVILDPPRKGCDEALLQTLCEMDVKHIVYVSCKPSTLARDLAYLGERGFVVERTVGVDMFPHSTHMETIVALYKKD